MRKVIISLLVGLSVGLFAQDLYDLETVQTIEIVFEEDNWDAILDAEKAGDENYTMAQSVTINGVFYDSVGVKYKGNSTYSANQTKNPFHIELDTYKDQDYDGYKDIKLSNVANDPSFVREVLSYQILRQYMDAPLSNYANVYVNGSLMGLYSNSEAINKTFVKDRFGSKNNTFIKCNPIEGAGQGVTTLPNLVYEGEDSTDYYDEAYELKSDYGWAELIDFTDSLENDVNDIEEILDVDRALWMLAFDNVFVNLDSYIGGFAQNYYLYKDDNGRFLPIVWDLNESFGRFTQTGTNVTLSSTADKQQMTHLLHENDADYPLVQQLLSVPMYKRMYLAHYKTMLLENFDDGSYYETGLALQATIDADVQADGNKFFTYDNFIDNLTDDITSGGRGATTTNGITSLMDGRNDYLLGLGDFTATEPVITDVALSDDLPVIDQAVTVTASVANANAVYVGYREDGEDVFIRYEMFDDGAHNDGSANDGVYGTDITVLDAYSQYYIYAENDEIGFFSPRRAEYEFYYINATVSNVTIGDLVINEFMASNDTYVADQDGEFDDWIEIYNNGDSEISLDGYSLSDDAGDLAQWSFPSDATIGAGEYVTVWADKDTLQEGYHANFKLSSSNETVVLVNAEGEIIDEISYSDQETDSSFARLPNGIGAFEIAEATFGEENGMVTGLDAFSSEELGLIALPNPATGSFILKVDNANFMNEEFLIYDFMGRQVDSGLVMDENVINTSSWGSGMYIIKVANSSIKVTVN